MKVSMDRVLDVANDLSLAWVYTARHVDSWIGKGKDSKDKQTNSTS